MKKRDGLLEKNCDICGKLIIPTPQWMYKKVTDRKSYFYCSYTCYRKAGGDNGKYISYVKARRK